MTAQIYKKKVSLNKFQLKNNKRFYFMPKRIDRKQFYFLKTHKSRESILLSRFTDRYLCLCVCVCVCANTKLMNHVRCTSDFKQRITRH